MRIGALFGEAKSGNSTKFTPSKQESQPNDAKPFTGEKDYKLQRRAMKDIAFHITDIAENCIRAGADRIGVTLSLCGQCLELIITDNGCGMSQETIRKVTDPFYTTRTTRKVGLGLPFLFQNTEQCSGKVEVLSEEGKGTQVKAYFMLDNIDCPPTGDLDDTLMQLIAGNPEIESTLTLINGENVFQLSTVEIINVLDGLPTGLPEVATTTKEIIRSNLTEVFGETLRF